MSWRVDDLFDATPATTTAVLLKFKEPNCNDMFYYPNWVYERYSHHVPTVIKGSIEPFNRRAGWRIIDGTTSGIEIEGKGPQDANGHVSPVDDPGTFYIRFKDAEDEEPEICYKERKTLIVDIDCLKDWQMSEWLFFITQAYFYGIGRIWDFWDLHKEASRFAGEGIPSEHFDAANHLMWQALLTIDCRYGARIAMAWGRSHELAPKTKGTGLAQAGSFARDTSMDIHNNKIGRNVGKAFGQPDAIWSALDPQTQEALEMTIRNKLALGRDPCDECDPEVPAHIVRIK